MGTESARGATLNCKNPEEFTKPSSTVFIYNCKNREEETMTAVLVDVLFNLKLRH